MGTKKPNPICLSEEAGCADEETLECGYGRAAGSVIPPVSILRLRSGQAPGNGLNGLEVVKEEWV
jgi:hypothetical protein